MRSPSSRLRQNPLAGLVWTLVRTDFKTRFHGTLGGFVWAILKPITMFIVLLAIFSFIFATDPAYKLNLIVGLFLWDFFAESTKSGLISLQAKSFLLTKASFPRWILVAVSSSNALLTLFVFSVLMISFVSLVASPPGAMALVFYLVYLLHYLLIVTGISLATSVLFVRYRDLNQVWEVVLQAGFFIAPIIYPLEVLPERFHFFLYLWPPTAVIQFSRQVLVAGTVPTLKAHVLLVLVTASIFLVGLLVYRRQSARAAELI